MSQAPISIDLDQPFTTPLGVQVDQITIRRYTVAERRKALRPWGDDPADQEIALIAHLAGLVPEDLDMMDSADYAVVQEAFNSVSAATESEDDQPIHLAYPVGGVSEVEMRRSTVGDQRRVMKQWKYPVDQEAALLSNLSGVPLAVLDQFDAADYGAMLARFQRQFRRTHRAGGPAGGDGAAGEVVPVPAE